MRKILREIFGVDEAPHAQQGLRITGSQRALEALEQALNVASGAPPTTDWSVDEAEWAGKACMTIGKAVSAGNGSVTLPEFEATPDLDSFDDDDGIGIDPNDERGY